MSKIHTSTLPHRCWFSSSSLACESCLGAAVAWQHRKLSFCCMGTGPLVQVVACSSLNSNGDQSNFLKHNLAAEHVYRLEAGGKCE